MDHLLNMTHNKKDVSKFGLLPAGIPIGLA